MKKCAFNDNWLFYKDGHEDEAKPVNLPHDAMLFEKRYKGCVTGNGCAFFEGGKYIYTKRFDVPEECRNKYMAFEFEGVYKNANVYINGELAAERPYGYSNFYVEAGDYLKYGEENEIRVVADNSEQPNSRWYSGSGIYRDVWMYMGEKTHIGFDGVRIQTVSLNPVTVSITVDAASEKSADADGKNAEDSEQDSLVEIRTEILFDGEKVAEGAGKEQKIILRDAKLWDEEHPNLYQCRTILLRDGKVIDETTENFGVRMLAWSSKGFFVNGKETLLRGACIHHDNGILGACAFQTAEERKVRLLKKAGFNAIRSSHNPVSRAMLDACDRYGMYLMDETFDQWFMHKNPYDYTTDFEEWWEKDTLAMVYKDFNHPSVIMYSIGNEISETALERGISLAGQMRSLIRTVDTTRLVTTAVSLMLNAMVSMGMGMYQEDKSASAGLDNLSGSTFVNMAMIMFGKFMDVIAKSPMADKASRGVFANVDVSGYNYGRGRYEKDAKKYPNRVIVGSETLPPDIYDNWQKVKELPGVIGDFIWTGWDYIGESGIACTQYDSWAKQKENPPLLLGGAGIIDITGKFRPEVWLNRAVYGYQDLPYIGVEPVIYANDGATSSPWRKSDALHSWSWKGCEGYRAKIVVYSNADEVALYKNGKLVGRKKVKKCIANFRTKYEPGKLVAVSYKDGRETGRGILKSAGEETRLALNVEESVLRANGQDLAYLDIAITDDKGIVKVTEERKIAVEVEGAGTLQGFGSANPHTDESFVGTVHETYYGRAQAIVRAGTKPGDITVTVSADGLKPQKIVIKVEAGKPENLSTPLFENHLDNGSVSC